jgi:hypothetical protein
MLRRRQKYLIVMDCLAVDHMVNARQRAAFGDFVMNPEARALSAFKVADVVLMRSALVRGAITAIFWVSPPVSPVKLCGRVDEVSPYVEQRFREEKIPFTRAMELRLARLGMR